MSNPTSFYASLYLADPNRDVSIIRIGNVAIGIGPDVTIYVNLENATRLRDVAQEIVNRLSPPAAEAAPDRLQWREEDPTIFTYLARHGLYYDGVKRAVYEVRKDGTAYSYDYKTKQAAEYLDGPTARRMCEEIARGER